MQRWIARTVAALGAALALLLVYGMAVEPRFVLDEERWQVGMPGVGQDRAGTEVAVVSDLQIGMWWSNEGMVERAVATIVEEDPDVALLGGDFVHSRDPDVGKQVSRVLELVAPLLDAGIPTFAVLGDHDHAVGAADELTTALEYAGVPVLADEAVRVPPSGPDQGAVPLYVVGIGPAVPGEVDVDAALDGVPDGAPRIVLMHDPTTFDRLPAGTAPLALAGHTHCGRVALPGAPRWSYLALTEEEAVVADGWAPAGHGAEGNRLFVTCGIGFSVAPVRINAPPQVAFFELVPGDGGR